MVFDFLDFNLVLFFVELQEVVPYLRAIWQIGRNNVNAPKIYIKKHIAPKKSCRVLNCNAFYVHQIILLLILRLLVFGIGSTYEKRLRLPLTKPDKVLLSDHVHRVYKHHSLAMFCLRLNPFLHDYSQ